MDDFLKKIKLAENFSLELDVNKSEFTNKLEKHTKPESVFASLRGDKKKLFVGSVNSSDISIRPIRSLEKSNFSFASQLKVKCSGSSKKVIIDGTIQISKKYFVMMFAPAMFYFAVVIPIFVINAHSLTMAIGILVQFLFMIGVFYFILRKAIKISKVYFEKELLLVTKHN